MKKNLFVKYLVILTMFFFILKCPAFSSTTNPIVEELLYKIRDPNTDKKDFRQSLEKIGEYLGLEIAKDFNTSEKSITTVMNQAATHYIVNEDLVIVTILRAGLPLFNGLLKVFPDAESGFFAMQRNEETLKAQIDYVALPPLKGKTVILADTMIATGGSSLDAIKILEKREPKQIIVLGVITAKQGLENIIKYNDKIKIYSATIDPTLNNVGYIVPGLGDAGDRSYGIK